MLPRLFPWVLVLGTAGKPTSNVTSRSGRQTMNQVMEFGPAPLSDTSIPSCHSQWVDLQQCVDDAAYTNVSGMVPIGTRCEARCTADTTRRTTFECTESIIVTEWTGRMAGWSGTLKCPTTRSGDELNREKNGQSSFDLTTNTFAPAKADTWRYPPPKTFFGKGINSTVTMQKFTLNADCIWVPAVGSFNGSSLYTKDTEHCYSVWLRDGHFYR
eukprot:gene10677-31284_t